MAAIISGAQIKHMVDRFLSWRLPDNFNPDGGISFKPSYPDEPMRSRHWPTGTNLIDATQAGDMVRHMIEGMPGAAVGEISIKVTAADAIAHVRRAMGPVPNAIKELCDAAQAITGDDPVAMLDDLDGLPAITLPRRDVRRLVLAADFAKSALEMAFADPEKPVDQA